MNSFDRAINNDFLVVTKSLLPYLNIDRQKPVAVFIKVIELLYTVNLYSNETATRSLSRGQDPGWEKNFLRDVKNNLPQEKAFFVDAVLKLAEAKDLLVTQEDQTNTTNDYRTPEYQMHPYDSGILEGAPFPDEGKSPQGPAPVKTAQNITPNGNTSSSNNINPEQIINGLSSMLDPNQAQMLKVLMSLLKPQS